MPHQHKRHTDSEQTTAQQETDIIITVTTMLQACCKAHDLGWATLNSGTEPNKRVTLPVQVTASHETPLSNISTSKTITINNNLAGGPTDADGALSAS